MHRACLCLGKPFVSGNPSTLRFDLPTPLRRNSWDCSFKKPPRSPSTHPCCVRPTLALQKSTLAVGSAGAIEDDTCTMMVVEEFSSSVFGRFGSPVVDVVTTTTGGGTRLAAPDGWTTPLAPTRKVVLGSPFTTGTAEAEPAGTLAAASAAGTLAAAALALPEGTIGAASTAGALTLAEAAATAATAGTLTTAALAAGALCGMANEATEATSARKGSCFARDMLVESPVEIDGVTNCEETDKKQWNKKETRKKARKCSCNWFSGCVDEMIEGNVTGHPPYIYMLSRLEGWCRLRIDVFFRRRVCKSRNTTSETCQVLLVMHTG